MSFESAIPSPKPITLSVLMPVYNERFLVEESVRRVLAFRHPWVTGINLIVVDDYSSDGTRDILRRLREAHPEITLIEHPQNLGKGAAIRRALSEAKGELSVIHDADLEYYPEDWALMLRPFLESNADAVFGSRLLSSDYRRVLYFWHSVGNHLLTLLSNMMTDLNLTDMETCYKMVRTELLKSIPIRSNDFRIEPELTAKLAKRGAIIYEVPIRYSGRTYREGKKIGLKDGFFALMAILKWKLIDDIYHDDEYGSLILTSLNYVHKFNHWMARFISKDVNSRVCEIGAGLGNLTRYLIPREKYLATDINPHYLAYLRNMSLGQPYLSILSLDLTDREAFCPLEGKFDTVICLNVLEHVADDSTGLKNLYSVLEPGGKAIVLTPQGQWLFSTLDQALEHFKRYSKRDLTLRMREAGFVDIQVRDFNRFGVLGWFLNGRILKRKHFSRIQLKIYNFITPLISRLDRVLPWHGLSVVAVGKKPEKAAV
jgi:glycosyltransferase involved in cell wall biosynthesis